MFQNIREIKMGLLTKEDVVHYLNNTFNMSLISHPKNPLLLGNYALLKVNTNIGVSSEDKLDTELDKLKTLAELPYAPDSLMDHTIIPLKKPLWKYMLEFFDKPVGTLPHYTAFHNNSIDKIKLMETIEEMAESGISFMTLHPTANLKTLEIANNCRSIATTSRGGVLILKDTQTNKRDVNVITDNFDEIIKIFKKYNMTMSIGTTFRPARIDEALDQVQLMEIEEQGKYITYAKSQGINVIMEGVGHISIKDIPKYCDLIKDFQVPLMPLGPMLSDATIGFDHITSAIGATLISMYGNIGTINSVTREEHTGGVPSKESIVEGLKSARVAAHCINLSRFERIGTIDSAVSNRRATSKTCVISGGLFGGNVENGDIGCSRCSFECPLSLL